MEKACKACGMPLTKKEEFALGDENADLCVYCANEDGSPKSCEEIFEGGVNFFMQSMGGDRVLAEKLVRKNMKQLPYWQDKGCKVLEGEVATDEEFAEAMKKLG